MEMHCLVLKLDKIKDLTQIWVEEEGCVLAVSLSSKCVNSCTLRFQKRSRYVCIYGDMLPFWCHHTSK